MTGYGFAGPWTAQGTVFDAKESGPAAATSAFPWSGMSGIDQFEGIKSGGAFLLLLWLRLVT
jgi:hypothetical protein